MQKWGERIFSNQQLIMRVYIRIIMIMVFRIVNFATSKNLVVKEHNVPTPKHSKVHFDLS